MVRRRTNIVCCVMVLVTASLSCVQKCSSAFTPNLNSAHSELRSAPGYSVIHHLRPSTISTTQKVTLQTTTNSAARSSLPAGRLNAIAVDEVTSGREKSTQQKSLASSQSTSITHWVPTTMQQALTTFFLSREYSGPRSVVILLVGLGTIWQHTSTNLVTECAVALTCVVFWWLQEHWMHQHLLHSRADWIGKEVHEKHHDKNYFHVSIDTAPLILGWYGIAFCLFAWMLPSWPLTLAATFGYGSAGLFYEWSHYIVHTKVRFPRDSFWQKMKDHHIRHHRVDSNYWLAFSVRQVDNLFGTNPDVTVARRSKESHTTGRAREKV